MKLLRAVLALAGALALQVALGRMWPESHRWVDLLLVPVVWYGAAGSQRSGMLVGCAGGLLQDAWFDSGSFGLNGFKKTLIGWVIGAFGSRFDLNRKGVRFLTGALAVLADILLDLGLRSMLDLREGATSGWGLAARAAVGGVIIAGAFGITDRVRQRRQQRRLAY